MGWGSCVAVSCGVGHRSGLDPILLWLGYRSAATAPIRPLARELLYPTGVALKSKKNLVQLPLLTQRRISGFKSKKLVFNHRNKIGATFPSSNAASLRSFFYPHNNTYGYLSVNTVEDNDAFCSPVSYTYQVIVRFRTFLSESFHLPSLLP